MDLPDLTGFRILRCRNGCEVDRAEFAPEARPGDAKCDLCLGPGLVAFLKLENKPDRIADRDELSDDQRMLAKMPSVLRPFLTSTGTATPSTTCISSVPVPMK
jgi:hypothetical protein